MKRLVKTYRQRHKGWHVETNYYEEHFLDEVDRSEETTIRPARAARQQMPSGSRFRSKYPSVAQAFDAIDEMTHRFQITL